MGLDMFLNANRSFWGFNEDDQKTARAVEILFPELSDSSNDGDSPIRAVVAEVGYWRKANAIHKWFVDHVQEGKDDCGDYYVSREQLTELKDICATVLADPKNLGPKLLPTASGFFFGETAYGEGYVYDLENTVRILENCLKLSQDWRIEYHSSW
jgi:hypothetical protein